VASTEQDERIKHEQECDEQQYRCHWLPPEVVQSKRFESVSLLRGDVRHPDSPISSMVPSIVTDLYY
jgi:hypothetical protein